MEKLNLEKSEGMDCAEKTLKNICIICIIDNMDINYDLAIKNNWKIPIEISNLIFKYYYERNKEISLFNAEPLNLKLFERKISSLSKFIFDELTTENNQFLEIDVNQLKDIDIFSESFIHDCEAEELKIFFFAMKNIEKLTLKSITKNSEIFSYISHFSKTLKILHLQNFVHVNIKPLILNSEYLEEFSLQYFKHNIWPNIVPEYIQFDDIFQLKKLKNLHLNSCNIDVSKEHLLEKNVYNWEHLNKLELKDCTMSWYSWHCLQEALESCSNINYIHLSRIIGLQQILSGLLSSSQNLNTLCISFCQFDKSKSLALKLLLDESVNLKIFELSSTTLDEIMFKDIISGLAGSSDSLQEISFANSLRAEHCEDMKNFLLGCTLLKKVDFSENFSIFDGIFLICEGFKTSSLHLKTVNFKNSIGEEKHLNYIKEKKLEMSQTEFCFNEYAYNENESDNDLYYDEYDRVSIYSDYDNEYEGDQLHYRYDYEPCYDEDGGEIDTYEYWISYENS